MKSSDCVVKHAGVYSTGLAMVVSFLSYLLDQQISKVMEKAFLPICSYLFPNGIALSLGSVSLDYLAWLCMIFTYSPHVFDYFLLFLLGNVQTASFFLTGKCTRNGNSSNMDPNNHSFISGAFIMCLNQTSTMYYSHIAGRFFTVSPQGSPFHIKSSAKLGFRLLVE